MKGGINWKNFGKEVSLLAQPIISALEKVLFNKPEREAAVLIFCIGIELGRETENMG